MIRAPEPHGRPLIMGIVNTTPDSFSDGGQYLDPQAAIAHGLQLVAEGADILDLGGESTRPGSLPVPPEEQIRRLVPVVRGLRTQLPGDFPISIDTTLAQVMEATLDAGASWINDISGGEDDSHMLALAAEREVPIVLMHRQGLSAVMQQAPHYEDVTREVCDYLRERIAAARAAGIDASRIILDPGIGFGKTTAHNLTLMAQLAQVAKLGCTVLLGTSRKRFLGEICGIDNPRERTPATCATTALGVMAGMRIFRVHDVAANRQAADTAWAIRQTGL